MNVSEQIIQVIDNLAQKFGIAIDWSAENIVPVFQQLADKYIAYEISTSVFFMILSSVVLAVGVIGYTILMINRKAFNFDSEEIFGYTVAFFLWIVACCIPISVQTIDIIKCNTFPELIIAEYIKNFIN